MTKRRARLDGGPPERDAPLQRARVLWLRQRLARQAPERRGAAGPGGADPRGGAGPPL